MGTRHYLTAEDVSALRPVVHSAKTGRGLLPTMRRLRHPVQNPQGGGISLYKLTDGMTIPARSGTQLGESPEALVLQQLSTDGVIQDTVPEVKRVVWNISGIDIVEGELDGTVYLQAFQVSGLLVVEHPRVIDIQYDDTVKKLQQHRGDGWDDWSDVTECP